MAKQTTKQANNKPAGKPARNVVAQAAAKATRKGRQQQADEAADDEADSGESGGTVSKWASERARAQSGSATATGREGDPCARHVRLLDVLHATRAAGKASISFADCNAQSGTKRGERGDAGASWRLHLSRARQALGAANFEGWRVDEAGSRLVFGE